MSDYQLTDGASIIRTADGAHIPPDHANRDYVEYLEWVEDGGVADPAPTSDVIVSSSASRLGLVRFFKEQGTWDYVKALIASDPDTQEEWDVAIEIKRTDPLVQKMITAMSLSESDVDALLIRANELTQ